MTPTFEQEAAELRHRLAQHLVDAGPVRSPQWRAAVEAVPRHLFVPEFFTTIDKDGAPTRYVPVDCRTDRWLELAYADDSLVTQLDGGLTPTDVNGTSESVTGVPTSSSTMPSLVVRMWEHLAVRDGDRVLEIGTGSGYSTALGCHRLGDHSVTSIEVDPAVAARAQAALEQTGYHPKLVVGDGVAGHPERAPYDRVIATCALRNTPPAWIEQCRPGAIIVVTLSGWLDATGLAKLTVTGPGTAEGVFVDPDVSFMPARSHAPEFLFVPERDNEALLSERPTAVGPEVFTDWGPVRRVIQLAAPNAQHLQLDDTSLLVESDESYVSFHPSSSAPSGWLVRQGGRRALWDRVEPAITAWRKAGEPPLTAFRITVAPGGQRARFSPDHSFELPR